jgi:hypothetical protein
LKTGKITLSSSMENLNEGFKWAKEQALSYGHDENDPVGLWYEAALPGRNAFCVRDVCHQAGGAGVLGLAAYTKNMLYQFARHISAEKDYCTWWEITKDGKPCPEDYKSDQEFWYNLPANFEIIRACYLEYLWTGDRDYVTDPIFLNFYKITCQEYVQKWDADGDGLLEHYPEQGIRGIATYNEADVNILTAGDMLGSQYAGYGCFAQILKLCGKTEEAQLYLRKQQALKEMYLKSWYDETSHCFYGAKLSDGGFYQKYDKEGNFLPLLFGVLNHEAKMKDALRQLREQEPANVESRSYYAQIYYACGDETKGYEYLDSLCDPLLGRREYPEVSYALVGTVVGYMMGIQVNEDGAVVTRSRLPEGEWAGLKQIPLRQEEIDVTHHGKTVSMLTNHSEKKMTWKAVFVGHQGFIWYKNQKMACSYEKDVAGEEISFVCVEVAAGEAAVLKVCEISGNI